MRSALLSGRVSSTCSPMRVSVTLTLVAPYRGEPLPNLQTRLTPTSTRARSHLDCNLTLTLTEPSPRRAPPPRPKRPPCCCREPHEAHGRQPRLPGGPLLPAQPAMPQPAVLRIPFACTPAGGPRPLSPGAPAAAAPTTSHHGALLARTTPTSAAAASRRTSSREPTVPISAPRFIRPTIRSPTAALPRVSLADGHLRCRRVSRLRRQPERGRRAHDRRLDGAAPPHHIRAWPADLRAVCEAAAPHAASSPRDAPPRA